ncbi:MAG: hypothetical protein RL468_1705, partial [Pseudomonadota bacterium]
MKQRNKTPNRRQLLAVCAMSLLPGWAGAQTTDAPLKLIVPFSPGTGIDLVARQLGPKLAQKLSRP